MAAAAQGGNNRGIILKVDTLLAGGIAGGCARTITAPLDRVKILMQTQRLTSAGAEDKYKGLWQSLVRIYKEDGVRSYWRGNLANCVRVVPYSATQFMTFAHCKDHVCQYTGKEHPTVPERLCCGAIAGMMASFVTHPLDVVRTRMAVQPELQGITHTFATLWAEGQVTLPLSSQSLCSLMCNTTCTTQQRHGQCNSPFFTLTAYSSFAPAGFSALQRFRTHARLARSVRCRQLRELRHDQGMGFHEGNRAGQLRYLPSRLLCSPRG